MKPLKKNRIAEFSTDAFFRLDFGRGLVWLNAGFEKMTGWKAEAFLDQPLAWHRLFLDQGIEELSAAYQVFLKNPDNCISLPLEMRTAGGETLWIEATMVGSLDDTGTCIGLEGYARNMSEHVRAADLLVRRTQEQRALLDVQRDLLGELGLEETLAAIVEHAQELLRASNATLFLLDEDGKMLKPAASLGLYREAFLNISANVGEGIVGQVVASQKPLLLARVEESSGGVHVPGTPYEEEGALCAPLLLQERAIGALLLSGPPGHFEEDDLRFLVGLAQVATLAVVNSRQFSAVQYLAEIDALTGAYNRNFFNFALRKELKYAGGRRHPVGVLMIDVDKLKPINDRLGHIAGDQLLIKTVELLRDILRDTDWIARIGGDEFAVVLPGCSHENVYLVAQKLQQALNNVVLRFEDEVVKGIGTSIGGTSFPEGGQTFEAILNAIDQAEMEAKQSGGNRIVLYPALSQ